MAHDVPIAATSFIGRDAELALLARLVSEGARVITLKGSGGSGKTRLAVQFALSQAGDPELDGISFASLAGASDVTQACEVVASMLELSFVQGAAIAARIERAASLLGRSLVVLDNVDALASGLAPVLSRWARAAPNTTWVVTSRERLRIPEERLVEVPPLDETSACELFVQRARSVRPDFSASPATLSTIAEIVRRLDANPLAVELCAARAGVLGVAQLLELLPERFELLTEGARGAPERHSTLSAAVEGSWSSLSPDERRALAELSVFEGGLGLEHAAQVLGDGTPAASMRVLGWLQSLVDKSLLVAYEPSGLEGTMRYFLLSSIAHYAADRLDELGSRAELEELHARVFCAPEHWQLCTRQGDLASRVRALELELDNIHRAFERMLRRADTVGQTLALGALEVLERAPTHQGAPERFEQALDELVRRVETRTAEPGLAAAHARALELRGALRLQNGEHERAIRDQTRARELYVRLSNRSGQGRCWASIALAESRSGREAQAETAFAHARAALDGGLDDASSALIHRLLAEHMQVLDRLDEASEHALSARDAHYRANDARGEGWALEIAGRAALERGDLDDAERHLDRSLELARVLSDVDLDARASISSALVHAELAHPDRAAALLEHARVIREEQLDGTRSSEVLRELANVELEAGRLEPALALLGQARELCDDASGRLLGLIGLSLAAALALGRDRARALDELSRAEHRLAHDGRGTDREAARLARSYIDGRTAPEPREAQGVEARRLSRLLGSLVASRSATPSSDSTVEAAAPDAASCRAELLVAGDGRWFFWNGARIDLGRRGPLRRVLCRLVAEHRERRGAGVSVYHLFEAAWPAERAEHEAATARVYVTVRRLRQLGLNDVLLTHDDGYVLDPTVTVRSAP